MMTADEIIKEAAGKFCGWKIPKDFYPDCYISVDREKAFAHPHYGPKGTNLFTFDQARAMFRECIGERIAELEAQNAKMREAMELKLPGGRITDQWESVRFADYNQGWNDYRKAARNALKEVGQ